jgi:cysteine-rich repeat protein
MLASEEHNMTRLGLWISCAAALAVVSFGCSSSTTNDPDMGGITFDAAIDAGPPDMITPPRDMRVPACGDSVLDPMEVCDDGNTVDTDGCTNMCRRNPTMPYCGDGDVEGAEQCDDGENFSGDGCSAACQIEECGNGVRDIGERCDRTPGCTCAPGTAPCLDASCDEITTCGNGAIDTGEQCDPTPAMSPAGSWDEDGCQSDCFTQQSLIVNALSIDRTMGCDYSGDGMPDNSFGAAFGGALGLLNGQLENAITDGQFILLLSMIGLENPASDPSLRVGWITGQDADADATNNFSGVSDFFGDMDAIGLDGDPVTSFGSSIVGGRVSGGPEDVTLPIAGLFPLDLRQGRINGVVTTSGDDVSGITGGLLCGVIPVGTFAGLPNFIEMFGGGTPAPPCDDTVSSTNLGDVLLGGARVGPIRVGPAQPDVDLDGDGLEFYVVDDTGTAGCQAVVTGCIDGDGTMIPGHDCSNDERMADGWSAGLPFTAVGAVDTPPSVVTSPAS